jgi:uncharacterized protein (TIGR00251 family)
MSDLLVEIRVRPNSSRNKVGGTAGDPPRLIVAVQAPAVDGKANAAVLKLLAESFGVRVRDLAIVHGELSRDKRIVIASAKPEHHLRYEALKGEAPKLL